jgi:hypothetical protein
VIDRSKRFFQALGTVLANLNKTIREARALFAADPIEALANGRGDCCGQRFSGSSRELFSQAMRLRVLDV